MPVKLKEYEAHVHDERTSNEKGGILSFCGEQLQGWYFTGADHVVYNAMAQGRLLPCQKCLAAILSHLKPLVKPIIKQCKECGNMHKS